MNEQNELTEEQGEQVVNQDKQETQTQSKSVALDLNEYGDMEIYSGGSKPVFEKITKATVVNAEMKTTPERIESTDKEGKKQTYYPVFLNVEYKLEDGNTTYENYSGGRLFVSETDKSKKFWLGESSALGKLKKLIEDNFEFKGSLKELPEKIINQSVGIKTETLQVAGKEYKKNIIEVFYKS